MNRNNNEPDLNSKGNPDNAYDAIKELLFRRVINPGQKLPYVVENIEKCDVFTAEKYIRKHIEALHTLMLEYLRELKQKKENFLV